MPSRRKAITNDSATYLGFETDIRMERACTFIKVRHPDLSANLKGLGNAL